MTEPLLRHDRDDRGVVTLTLTVHRGDAAAYVDAGTTMAGNMMDPSALEGVLAFIEKRPTK